MTLREKIEVMQAFERGEEIEFKAKVDSTWDSVDLTVLDWALY